MSLPECQELALDLNGGVLSVTLNRPHKRNAMNSQMVQELISVLDAVAAERSVRVLVLRGAEGNFCAGGDISGMNQESQPDDNGGKDASWRFNRSFGILIAKLNRAPQLVVCVLEGAVLGGGFGLACVSDYAIADKDAMFAMPETSLGIIPAQISPFVVSRIGITQARRLALFGVRINGPEAVSIGLVHEVSETAEGLQAAIDKALKLAQRVAPNATAVTKQLLLDTHETPVIESILDRAADDFTAAIMSAEGQEGTLVFVEKRKPSWVKNQLIDLENLKHSIREADLSMQKFEKILVANRGEIAVRVMRTAQRLGYAAVAVYSDADAQAPHTLMADEAVNIGASAPSESYLVIDKIIGAAKSVNAQAIHPGYGFLSENAEFAERCEKEGIVFIGPSADAIRLMGSKRLSKLAMLDSKVPCIPGYQGADQDDATLIEQAKNVGLPLMIKASAGGGGRGMRIVHDHAEVASAIDAARAEARSAFGSDELILERAVVEPRHIEIQVFGDQHGNVVHLGERDCSIQRRHQKVVEESPSPFVSEELRVRMGEAAINAAKACNYVGAGTVEFLVDAQGEFFFLEMNTRLQVEHPVTELVTGFDLVEWQLKVADGQRLPALQSEIGFTGHAIEVRLCAEDPRANFMPQTGEIAAWRTPNQENLRVDSGISAGQSVSPFYDSMLAKVIGYGVDRDAAIQSLRSGLKATSLLGTHSNKHFLHTILGRSRFIKGEATTAFLAQEYPDGRYQSTAASSESLAIAAALFFEYAQSKFDYPVAGWSAAEVLSYRFKLTLDGAEHDGKSSAMVKLSQQAGEFLAQLVDEPDSSTIGFVLTRSGAQECSVRIDGVTKRIRYAFSSTQNSQHTRLFLDDGQAHLIIDDESYMPATIAAAGGDAEVKAAMDGAIVEVKVKAGQEVEAGEVVAVLEAMKMAHQLKASVSGTVEEVMVEAGQQVKTRQVIVRIAAGE